MGRFSKSGKRKRRSFDDLLTRHRVADNKYRSAVQFMYCKMKLLLRKKTAKDGLLDGALGFIHFFENEIHDVAGHSYLEVCKKGFLNVLVQEEQIWKRQKDVNNWWEEVEGLVCGKEIINECPLDLRVQKNSENDAENDHLKSLNQLCKKNSKISKAWMTKNLTSCLCNINKHVLGMPSHLEDSSYKYGIDFSSSWSFSDSIALRPLVIDGKENSNCKEPTANSPMKANEEDMFNTSLPLDVPILPVPFQNFTNLLENPCHKNPSFL